MKLFIAMLFGFLGVIILLFSTILCCLSWIDFDSWDFGIPIILSSILIVCGEHLAWEEAGGWEDPDMW